MFTRPPFPRSKVPQVKPQYIVLFKGDDSDFQGNQSVDIVIDTELDTTGMKAHFRFMDFVQDFDSIPDNKTLSLVFPNAKTSEFPLGAADATLRFEDASGKFRTVSNRIHIVVTNSVPEAYDNEDSQSITVTAKGTVTWDMIEGKPDIPTEFPQPSDDAPLMDGEAAAGKSTKYSRGDHVHPTDTSRASVEDATLNPIYEGGTPTYSEWVCDPPEATVGWDDTQFDGWYISYAGSSATAGSSASDPNATSLSANFGAVTVIATRTITNFGGYVLGVDEPSAPNHGKYLAGIENIPDVVAPSTAAAAAGKAADAKATGDALAGKLSRAEAVAGYTEWEVESIAAGYQYVSCAWIDQPGLWEITLTDYRSPSSPTIKLAINAPVYATVLTSPEITLSRVKLRPTKTSELENDSGFITSEGIAGKLNGDAAYPEWTSTPPNPYPAGARVSHNGYLYQLGDEYAGTDSEPGVSEEWGSIRLEDVKQDALTPAQMDAANSGATAEKVREWDGYAAQIALKADAADLRYRMVTVNDSHLCDRAGNKVVVTGNTTLTLPAAITGYLRDFLVRLEISGSTVPTITFQGQGSEAPNGADELIFETDGDEFPVPTEAGTWLYSFTEDCVAHVFAVSLKQLQSVSQQTQAQGGS